MQLNRQTAPRSNRLQCLDQLLSDLLESYQALLDQKNITLVEDFDEVKAHFDVNLMTSAVRALVENAIQSMPLGGELTSILIDGDCQWELEISDTVWPSNDAIVRQMSADNPQLPVILPFPENEYLRAAHRAAIKLGGQIQTWNCPLGGTAHVLVIPKQRF